MIVVCVELASSKLPGLMDHFECPACAFAVVGVEKVGLSDERFCLKANLISPADEIGEVNIEGEILMAGILVGFGWKEALVLEIGPKSSERTAVIDFFRVATVIDGDHLAALP